MANFIQKRKLNKFRKTHGLTDVGEQCLGYLIDRYINRKDCGTIAEYEDQLDDLVRKMKENTNEHMFFYTIANDEVEGRALFRNYCAIEIISSFLMLIANKPKDFEYFLNLIEDDINRITILNEVTRREAEFE